MAARTWYPSSNSEQELHDWTLRMWRRMDRDNSGALTRQELDCEEFYAIIRSVLLPGGHAAAGMGGAGYGRAEMDMSQAIYFALRKADLNDDNKLSFDEFQAFVSVLRQPQLATHTANLVFSLFDLDRNQWVDEFEFRQIYRFYLGRNPTEAEFQEEWARLDSTNRGRVNREEYVKWLQTSSNPIFRAHSLQPMSKVMSGKADYHSVKREAMTDLAASGPVRAAASSQGSWRPWHPYTNMAWAQVRNGGKSEDGETALSRPKSTGALNCAASKQRLSRSAGSMLDRPRWNHRLATANPNLPDSRGIAHKPRGTREFMSTPQSREMLASHYRENPGFGSHLRNLQQPDAVFRQQSKCSNDRLEVGLSPELLPGRSKLKHGRMKNPKTGKREYWEDNWRRPAQLRDKYVAGTNSLRSLGPPPRYMYVDECEDPVGDD